MSRTSFSALFRTAASLPGDTYLSTGIFSLDMCTLGGFKENKIHLLFGPKGSAKTTTAYNCIKSALNKYPESKVLLLDLENSFDERYALDIGIDLTRLIMPAQRDVSEEHLDNYLADIKTGIEKEIIDPDTGKPLHISLIILDSLAAAMTEKELTDVENVERGGQYRAKASKKLYNYILAYAKSVQAVERPLTFITITQASEEKTFTGAISYNPTGGKSSEFAATNIVFLKGKPIQANKATVDIKCLFDKDDIKRNPEAKLVTEVDFTLKKQRSTGGMQGTVFIPHQSSDSTGVHVSKLINMPFIFSSAKHHDILQGSSPKGYYFVFDEATRYPNQDAVKVALATNKELEQKVAEECLKQERVKAGLSPLPVDDYLWGRHIRDSINKEDTECQKMPENTVSAKKKPSQKV